MKSKTIISLALSLVGSSTIYAQTKPNVLVIMTDQQSYNMMSCMGDKWLSTPNMDKIASMGYRFEKTYCVNPVCMPSRYSLLTGHYASEVGIKDNTYAFDAEKVKTTIASGALGILFQKAGYETLYSGKVHLYGANKLTDYGFKLDGYDPYDGPAICAEKFLPEYAKAKQTKPFLLFLSFMNPHDICLKAGAAYRFNGGASEDITRETKRLLAVQKTLSPETYQKQIPRGRPIWLQLMVNNRKWYLWTLNQGNGMTSSGIYTVGCTTG